MSLPLRRALASWFFPKAAAAREAGAVVRYTVLTGGVLACKEEETTEMQKRLFLFVAECHDNDIPLSISEMVAAERCRLFIDFDRMEKEEEGAQLAEALDVCVECTTTLFTNILMGVVPWRQRCIVFVPRKGAGERYDGMHLHFPGIILSKDDCQYAAQLLVQRLKDGGRERWARVLDTAVYCGGCRLRLPYVQKYSNGAWMGRVYHPRGQVVLGKEGKFEMMEYAPSTIRGLYESALYLPRLEKEPPLIVPVPVWADAVEGEGKRKARRHGAEALCRGLKDAVVVAESSRVSMRIVRRIYSLQPSWRLARMEVLQAWNTRMKLLEYRVSVSGPGSTYCMIKGGPHKSNRIYFTAAKGVLRQRCFDEQCKAREPVGKAVFSWKSSSPEYAFLFGAASFLWYRGQRQIGTEGGALEEGDKCPLARIGCGRPGRATTGQDGGRSGPDGKEENDEGGGSKKEKTDSGGETGRGEGGGEFSIHEIFASNEGRFF